MLKSIDTVIFDIGNVLIHWSPEHLYRKLIPDDRERADFLTHVCSMDWNIQQDLGRSWEDAVTLLSDEFPEKRDLIRAYDTRWHEMVPGEISGSVEILRALQQAGTALFAITNFSAEKFAETQIRFPFLAESFRDTIVSAQVGLLKPDARIYQLLIERNGLTPECCVFIDDSPANVEGARACGMSAIHFTEPRALCEDLRYLGLPV
ncbi:hydrolase [Roseibium aquae]|uniref:Hydrolase n=1 Tax=Roseibium aquae TaxID=1323746 RepID=A0A916X3C7_9HYPH|nr:HAD family phosphatase [Roseibium aquae]GGB57418.1 hydrolase [Roseibium aquae]